MVRRLASNGERANCVSEKSIAPLIDAAPDRECGVPEHQNRRRRSRVRRKRAVCRQERVGEFERRAAVDRIGVEQLTAAASQRSRPIRLLRWRRLRP